MRPTLFLLHRDSPDPAPAPERFSAHVLAELLALNEEMIEQLCLERVTSVGRADFLTGMINQHEKTAALLRTQLACPTPGRPEVKAEATRLFRTG